MISTAGEPYVWHRWDTEGKRYGRDEKNVCRLKPQTYEL